MYQQVEQEGEPNGDQQDQERDQQVEQEGEPKGDQQDQERDQQVIGEFVYH